MDDIEGLVEHGSPACAGIDPKVSVAFISAGGFPRLRGDRPQ